MPSNILLQDNAMITIFDLRINVYGAIIAFMIAVFLFALYRAQKAERLNWLDMITSTGSNKVSTTKILQLVGGVVATWIVIKLTLQGALNWDIFAIYLGYVASIDGFSKLLLAKYGSANIQQPAQQNYDLNQPLVNNTLNQNEHSSALDNQASRGAVKPPQD